MQKGNCSLCGIFCDLTYEHLPPKSAFNKKTRYQMITYDKFLKSENFLEEKFNGRIEQGGIGVYSLCRKCNNFLGLNYVKAYNAYSNSFIDSAKKIEFNYFDIKMHNFQASKVLKQIVSMFLSLNGWEFSQHYPDLRKYIFDIRSQSLPSKYRIFSYLKTEGNFRYCKVSVIGNLTTNGTVMGTEIAFPPLGHLMTIDFQGTLPFLNEITSFKDYSTTDFVSVDFKLTRLPTFSPFLLDYRAKNEIETTIEENNKFLHP